jgi:hypothetical protein
MKNLKRLGAAVVLTLALGLSALGGEILTPPCPPPEPGEILTPPCGAAPGDMETPTLTSTSGELGAPTDEGSFSKIAADVLLNLLPLF